MAAKPTPGKRVGFRFLKWKTHFINVVTMQRLKAFLRNKGQKSVINAMGQCGKCRGKLCI